MHIRKILFSLLLGGILVGYAWLFVAATSFPTPELDRPLLFYSNQSRQDIKLTLCAALNRAKKSIYLMMYGITDPEMIALLAKKASTGISTEIQYDKKASADLKKKLPACVQACPFASKGLMHRKILIIDDTTVFLGSANLTTASLKHHDNLVVGLFHPGLASFLRHGTGQHFSFEVDTQSGELWLLPDKEDQALNQLIGSLEGAQKTIQIAMFTLTHLPIGEALIRAHRRGVAVQVAVDYYTARGASQKMIQKLGEAGIGVYLSKGQELLHHKWALIDGEKLIMGSANWTKAAFAKNEDFLLFFSSLAEEERRFLGSLWKAIERESFSF